MLEKGLISGKGKDATQVKTISGSSQRFVFLKREALDGGSDTQTDLNAQGVGKLNLQVMAYADSKSMPTVLFVYS